MSKPTITLATIRKHGIRGVFADIKAALIGQAYDWRITGNDDAAKITNEFSDKLEELVREYNRAIGQAVSR